MLERWKKEEIVVGLKQSLRAISAGKAASAYVAEDAQDRVKQPILDLCRAQGVAVSVVATKKELGDACGIDVGAAVVVVLQ